MWVRQLFRKMGNLGFLLISLFYLRLATDFEELDSVLVFAFI